MRKTILVKDGARLPAHEFCVLPAMLDRQAEEQGEKIFAAFDTGVKWTFKDAKREGRSTAAALGKIGVRRGEPVLVWLPSTEEIVRIHFGLSYLGAPFVPVNLALKGSSLEHIIVNSGARKIICHAQLIDRLDIIGLGALDTVVVIGGEAREIEGLTVLTANALDGDETDYVTPSPAIQPWETHGIFYTSGTTGPSKGVLCPHVHTAIMGATHLRHLEGEDRFLINIPYSHIGAALVLYGALVHGVSVAMIKDFRTNDFLDEVKELNATSCFLLGAHSTFLTKREPSDEDCRNPLKQVIQIPMSGDTPAFSKRFGLNIHTVIDMTEMGPAIMSDILDIGKQMPLGFCGRKHDYWARFDVRLVDENDVEVPVGNAGELTVRCDMPWVITPGYHNNPEATAKAWRNGWFHTGDVLRRDEDGNYFFVDRIKDSLRRRGENISSAELEGEILKYSKVADVAAVAAKSDTGDDEVLVVIQPKSTELIDLEDLTNFLIPRLPHYMVPRYIRIIEKMPYTSTNKVQKSSLREDGITDDTWDREKAGIQVRRQIVG